jgi:hypothetical protein
VQICNTNVNLMLTQCYLDNNLMLICKFQQKLETI